jgi:hypothetical protein
MSALRQLAAGASLYSLSRDTASASSDPWLMWHAFRPLKSLPTACVLLCLALLLLRVALGTQTKSTF